MNSDKYGGSNPGRDYAHGEEGDIWAKSDMPEYTELPEPDEFTKLAHKVVIYGTVLAVVAIGISDAVAAGVSAKSNNERAVAVDQSDARHLDHTFENGPK